MRVTSIIILFSSILLQGPSRDLGYNSTKMTGRRHTTVRETKTVAVTYRLTGASYKIPMALTVIVRVYWYLTPHILLYRVYLKCLDGLQVGSSAHDNEEEVLVEEYISGNELLQLFNW